MPPIFRRTTKESEDFIGWIGTIPNPLEILPCKIEPRICPVGCALSSWQARPSAVKLLAMPPKKNSAAARSKVLAQWRGVDYAPLEAARATPARTAGQVLPSLLKELRLEARQADAEIVKVWNSLIDPAVTAHAQPANLHKGTLFVNVDNNAWLSEIVRYRRKEILDRLQNSFGKTVIQKISFRIG